MRHALETRVGARHTYTATFDRIGVKSGWVGPTATVLFVDVRDDSGHPVCDHLWFNLTKAFAALDLKHGDVVQFEARADEYVKGYQGRRDDVYKPVAIDYRLVYPTKIKRVAP